MTQLPGSVLAYLSRLAADHRSPAYLLTNENGLVSHWGGELVNYGIVDLSAGEPVGQQVFFLEGLLPLAGEGLSCPAYIPNRAALPTCISSRHLRAIARCCWTPQPANANSD
ncbi:MAG: hypothetical protein M3X11_11580 [Acidobacteriota bacterium]|nr:hypothetical protein [Acidobacteriota bacterium]